MISVSSTEIEPVDLPSDGDSVSGSKIKPVDPPSDGPPFERETTCYFFVPCFTFPIETICALPKNLCGGAYTFANSCYLSVYNCEHPSNGKFSLITLCTYPKTKTNACLL